MLYVVWQDIKNVFLICFYSLTHFAHHHREKSLSWGGKRHPHTSVILLSGMQLHVNIIAVRLLR